MVWLLEGNDAVDFERCLGEVQDRPELTASGTEVGANHREVDILESLFGDSGPLPVVAL